MPPIVTKKQEERVLEKRSQQSEEEKSLKPLTVRRYKLERESLRHRREREATPHKQIGPVVLGRQPRRRPRHGENKWWRDLGLSAQHTPLINSQSLSTYSQSSATSSENGFSECLSSRPSTPRYSTPTPYKGHIPKIMVTDAESSSVALDRNPCMLSNKDYQKHMQTLSNSMPTLFKRHQQRKVHSPKSPSWQPPSHCSDNLVKLPQLSISNCQMTRSSSCDLPSNKTLPKLPRSIHF